MTTHNVQQQRRVRRRRRRRAAALLRPTKSAQHDPGLATPPAPDHAAAPPVELPPWVAPEPGDAEDLTEGMTRRAIMAELSALGVEHDPRARKANLAELLRAAVIGEDLGDGNSG